MKSLERLTPQGNGLILVCNHPSKLDPALVPLLFFPRYLWHPIQIIPWSIPDEREYYNKWWFFLFKFVSIPIDRTNATGKSQAAAARKMLRILRQNGIVILFAERRKTFKSVRENDIVCNAGGKTLGRLKDGVGLLAKASETTITPLWIEETDAIWPNEQISLPKIWRLPIRIKVGETLSFLKKSSAEDITQEITKAFLKLADQ